MRWIIGFAGLWFFSCAIQVPPTGGPEDTTPPVVVRTFPEPSAVNVPRDTYVEFEFSEKIDRDTFPGALFVSPEPRGKLKLKFRGRKVQIRFPDLLLPDRTYVLTLGTDLKDNHGVALANAYTLAFSTGDSLDHGEIRGRVFDPKPKGVKIWAFILPDSGANGLADPRKGKGDYVTQTGDQGEFRFRFLSRGWYRLFAVRDQGKNDVYDPVEDDLGLAAKDVVLRSPDQMQATMNFILFKEDTTRPTMLSASMLHRSQIEVRFDEAVVPAKAPLEAHFRLLDLDSRDTLSVLKAARFALDARVFYLVTQPVDRARRIRVSALNFADSSGNALDTAYAYYDISAVTVTDTVPPKLVRMRLEPGATHVDLETDIRFYFSEWMQVPDSATGIRIETADSVEWRGTLTWVNPFELRFQPEKPWQSRTRYRIRVQASAFRDLAGNALVDTVQERRFTTIDKDTLAAISGRLQFRPALRDTVPIYLRAKQVVGGGKTYTLRLNRPGTYHFDAVLPGVYLIDGYLDRNRNGRHDLGTLDPYVPAEFFFFYSDSIKVRSKWPNAGNDILVEW